ncbi:MAG: type I-E CRISPR-associated protein Cas5/CasD [Bacteroidota bacterium]|nr:type I-E CRISPR-associated protein Cas5/CasD [Candidatus Kapabacteria bacterium]MDW8220793.1 type I-E CRISPR-associated protein Cas5/CasD [Bacteroidota bacterium]
MSRRFLCFRIYAPFAAFGSLAVSTERDTVIHPTKSSLVGLVAAAFGIKREEQDKTENLSKAVRFAVRVDAPSFFWQDYHTVQTPGNIRNIPHKHWKTRWEELGYSQEYSNRYAKHVETIISYRNYVSNALYTVCLWLCSNTTDLTLERIKERLEKPVFTLYAGRKSCPLALPLAPRIVEAETVKAAFDQCQFSEQEIKLLFSEQEIKLLNLLFNENRRSQHYFWEDHGEHIGIQPTLRTLVRDEPRSRTKWQFGERFEYTAILHEMTTEEKRS